jgi:hypothetical protein
MTEREIPFYFGGYMTYELKGTKFPMDIKDREYATDSNIQFSKFDSCIGVIARKDGQLTGIHLVMFAEDDSKFDNDAAQTVSSLLGSGSYDEIHIAGCVGTWKENVSSAYEDLKQLLQQKNNGNEIKVTDNDRGIYGAKITSGHIEITYKKQKD